MQRAKVTSLAFSRSQSQHDIAAMRLAELWDRNEACVTRYNVMPKRLAIDYDLRPDSLFGGYSTRNVVGVMRDIMGSGLRGAYPFEVSYMSQLPGMPQRIESSLILVDTVDAFLTELESKLTQAEAVMHAASAGEKDS